MKFRENVKLQFLIAILGIILIKFSFHEGIVLLTISYYLLANNKSYIKVFYSTLLLGFLYFILVFYWSNSGLEIMFFFSLISSIIFVGSAMMYKYILEEINKKNKFYYTLKIILLPILFTITKFITFEYFFDGATILMETPPFLIALYGIIDITIVLMFTMIFSIILIEMILKSKVQNKKKLVKPIIFVLLFILISNFNFTSILENIEEKDNKNEKIKIVSIQGNFNQDIYWRVDNKEKIMEYYRNKIHEIEKKENPDIYLLPENVMIHFGEYNKKYLLEFVNISNQTNSIIIYGSTTDNNFIKETIATVIEPNMTYSQHISQNPFEDIEGEERYIKGDKTTIFNTSKGKFAILICLEAVLRKNVDSIENINELDALFVISNNFFLKEEFEFEILDWNNQEIASSKRIDVISSSNTGPTTHIDKYGNIIKRTENNKEDYIVTELKI